MSEFEQEDKLKIEVSLDYGSYFQPLSSYSRVSNTLVPSRHRPHLCLSLYA